MVSKIKRTSSISIKDRRSSHRPRRKSSIKHVVAASSAVLASIQRRISNLFSKLARIRKPNRHKSYKILKKTHLQHYEHLHCDEEESVNAISGTVFFNSFQPRLTASDKRTVFLDLDETLVHSRPDPPPEKFDFVVRPKIDGEFMNFYVLKRPGVDEFLESLAAKFEVVVFTAAMKEYASMVLDRIDPKGLISERFYRDSCTPVDGRLVKDLSRMSRDLKRVVIVDDNPNSYANQPENGIPIKPFIDNLWDQELRKLKRFFEVSDCCDDMRDAVKDYLTEEA